MADTNEVNNASVVENVELFCESSSFEAESDSSGDEVFFGTSSEDEVEEFGVQPYQFEPVVDIEIVGEEQAQHLAPEAEENRRDQFEWCTCGNCQVMATNRECCCCRENERIEACMEEFEVKTDCRLTCITEHPGFLSGCLDEYTLDIAYLAYKQDHGGRPVYDANQRYRYTAYRQLVRWCWGYLGKEIRVVLPACAVVRIRTEYPSDNYEGFHFAG